MFEFHAGVQTCGRPVAERSHKLAIVFCLCCQFLAGVGIFVRCMMKLSFSSDVRDCASCIIFFTSLYAVTFLGTVIKLNRTVFKFSRLNIRYHYIFL